VTLVEISANRFQDFTAAVAEARARGLEVVVTRPDGPPYEARAEEPG
jgi:hypothetical protein